MNKAVNYYSDNLKKGGGVITSYILFFAMLSFPLLGFSADKVLYQKGSFIFAQKDANKYQCRNNLTKWYNRNT